MKKCAGAVGTLADKGSEVPRMDETLKLRWLYCPRCGGKTRTQIRPHTVLEDFPLFCPKCKYTCVIRFRDGKIEEIKMPDAQTQCRPMNRFVLRLFFQDKRNFESFTFSITTFLREREPSSPAPVVQSWCRSCLHIMRARAAKSCRFRKLYKCNVHRKEGGQRNE